MHPGDAALRNLQRRAWIRPKASQAAFVALALAAALAVPLSVPPEAMLRGKAAQLGLSDEQVAWIQRQDPESEFESMLLRNRLNQVYMNHAESIENPQVDVEVLRATIDELILAHGDLERRVA